MGDIVKTRSGKLNFFPGRVGVGVPPSQNPGIQLTIGGNVSATGAILANGSITTDSYIYSDNYLGSWNGIPISGSKVVVEGVDIRSTIVAPFVKGGADFYLKAAPDGTATWDTITDNEIFFDNQYVDGDLTVVGDIIEYPSSGVVYSKTSVFTKTLVSGANTLNTFDKSSFKTAKYVVTLFNDSSTTAFEILVTHNGTNGDGTTYGIVDAQASSLLSTIDVSVSGIKIDLNITTTGECDVIAHGTAHY
tara:strand:+ start:40 stop:783 length:744 start_codon:yes stop_codon:yes gene_type:complete